MITVRVINREHKFPSDPNAKIISVTDLKGIITEVNDTFVEMSGFSREELIGQPQNIVRHPDMPPEDLCSAMVNHSIRPSIHGLD